MLLICAPRLQVHLFYFSWSEDEAELPEREGCSEEEPDDDVACRFRFLLSFPLSFPLLSPFSLLLFFSFFRFLSFFFLCFLSFFECLSLRDWCSGAEGGSCCRCMTAVAQTLPRSACPPVPIQHAAHTVQHHGSRVTAAA